MNALLQIKNLVEKIPYSIGKYTSYVPYTWRLGSTYSKFANLLTSFEYAIPEVRIKYVVEHLEAIVQYAQRNIPFYQKLYGREPIKITQLSDFESLPIITRSQIRVMPNKLKARCC